MSSLSEGDQVLLIIEDDVKFAPIMATLAREHGFKPVVAMRGDIGLALANRAAARRDHARLAPSGADGRFVLERLKSNPRTRHIPVHVISVVEKTTQSANMGAFAYLEKPVSKDALELPSATFGTSSRRAPSACSW